MDKINKIKIKDVTYEIGGGGSATVDSGLSATSENAVQNKVITSELEKKLDKSNFQGTIHDVLAKYDNFGGVYYGTNLHIQSQYTGATFTSEVTNKDGLYKLVNYTGSTSITNVNTGLYVIFKASDLGKLKNKFTNGKAFTAYICNPPSDGYNTHALYTIYQDLGGVDSMRGKQYVMTMGSYANYSDNNILNYASPTRISNATFESLYTTYSGDTSTMFFASWGDIRNAFESSSPSWSINGGQYDTEKIFIYSSSMVSVYGMEGEKRGYYVKFIEPNDFTNKQPGNTINLQYSIDNLWGAEDLDSMKTDIASNKTKIDSLETKVVYAEPDTASSAHTFTKTINGEKLYTTDNANRDIKLVTSVNGSHGDVTIDMSSYQTKTEAVKIARLTQAEYDALSTKDNNTLYIITDAQ